MNLVTLAAAWIAGLLIGLELDVYVPALVLFSLAALVLAVLLGTRGFSPWPALLAVVMLMALVRVELPQGTDTLMPSGGVGPVTVRGVVVNDPEVTGGRVEFIISVDALDRGQGLEEGRGRVLVFARAPREMVQAREQPHFRYGDRLELLGRLQEPPVLGNFDYRSYLASQGIRSIMSSPQEVRLVDEGRGNPGLSLIYDLRRRLSRGIDQALPEPQAALAQALLLGLRGPLAEDVTEEFRSTGTSHLLAISGLHVGIVLAISLGAGAWLMGRRRQLYLLLPLGSIWLYALLSGLSASVERAAIMGSIYLLAITLGRPKSILPALAVTAAVMVGLNPEALKDVSFQLSFTAVAGIAMLTTYQPVWDRIPGLSTGGAGWRRVLGRVLVLSLAISVAATLATLPLIAFNFQRIPTLGILATVLALPVLPFLLLTSVLAAAAGVVDAQLGQVVGWLAWVPLEYVLKLVHFFSRVPSSTISVPAFSGVLVWAYYGVFALVLLRPRDPGRLWGIARRLAVRGPREFAAEAGITTRLRLPVGIWLVSVAALSVVSATLWFFVVTGHDGRLHVYFLDVGQGDSVLIVTPEGRQVLVDGGPGPLGAARAVGSKTSLWDRDLDMVVLAHPDEDHFRGLVEVLERYAVDFVLQGSGVSENPLYLEWEKAVEGEETRRVTAVQGQAISLGGATWIYVLNPPEVPVRATGSDKNNNAIVLRLVHGKVSFLLTADIEARAEELLLREGLSLRSSVLKVAHHGSKTSTTPRFLAAVSPAAAVISAGADNRYGHPYAGVTRRLQSMPGGDRTYLTSERGDIEFITDGKRLWVRTAR